MADNYQRNKGRPTAYSYDKGGAVIADMGAVIGEVMNNVDPTRQGRVQVFVKQFASGDKQNKANWRTVRYCPPYAGATPKASTSAGVGTFNPGNQMSYGMQAAAPDKGVMLLCFFVGGDASEGYYVGCIPGQGNNHMTPAIGASDKYVPQNENQKAYIGNTVNQPVVEINNAPENTENVDNPKYFDQPKPVHSYLSGVMLNQGLSNDPVRGPITSSAQRESPSAVIGMSSPGRPIYQGGAKDDTIKQEVAAGNLREADINVTGRRGGHSIVMDDGNLEGKNNMMRFRTAKGHQITMSDDANSLYITHANGQIWIELGQEGTLDVYATNSINFRTNGVMNFHADQDINMFAGGKFNMKSMKGTVLQSDATLDVANKGIMTLYSAASIAIKSDGSLAVASNGGTWSGGGSMNISAGEINLNGGATADVAAPKGLVTYTMPDTTFNTSSGWTVKPNSLESIVTRAPTHEPWPYHNQGTSAKTTLAGPGQPTPPPGAPTLPAGISITKTN
jgi:hypothetical protein